MSKPARTLLPRLAAGALVWGATLIAAGSLAGQTSPRTDAWRWVRFTTDDGLPSNHVLFVAEVPGKPAWVGTSAGVAWFDGYRWVPARGLPTDHVQGMVAEDDGSLLAIMDDRLYRGDTSAFRRLPMAVDAQVVAAVPLGGDVLVLAASRLWRYRSGALTPFAAPGAPEGPVAMIWRSRAGSVWATGLRGLYRWDGRRWVVRLAAGATAIGISRLAEGVTGRGLVDLRLPESQRGLWIWQGAGPVRREAGEGRIQTVAIDAGPAGELATSSGYGDMRIWHAGVWQSVDLPATAATALALAFRPTRDLWVGTESGLFLYRRSSTRWTYWEHARADPRNDVSDVLRARDGAIWLATSHGVEVHGPDGGTRWIGSVNNVELQSVTALAQDDAGGIWLGSGATPFGALRFDGKTWRRFGPRDGLGTLRIHRIVKDRRGRLWFLGLGEPQPGGGSGPQEPGAFVYERGRFARFGPAEGLPSGRVYGIAEGPDRALWFATLGGLSRLRDGAWTHWTRASGLRNSRVFTVAVDSAGRAWFGDQYDGLGFIDERDRPRYLTEADGLVSNEVWSIAVGPDGALWVATWSGLSHYRDGLWTSFGVGDGLSNLHVWPVLPLEDRVYVGSHGGGLNILDLRDLRGPPPRVEMGELIVDQDNVTTRWRAHAFMGTVPSERTETRYRIDGGLWSRWSTRRAAFQNRLAAGRHQVEVEAKGMLGAISAPARATFAVPYPLYLRPAVFIPFGVLVAVLAVLTGALAQRKRHFDARQRELEAQLRQSQKLEAVGQLTSGIAHDLNNLLTVVLGGVELLRDRMPADDAGLGKELRDVEEAAQRGAAMIKKLLGFSRRAELVMQPADLGDLTESLTQMLRRVIPASISVTADVARPVRPVRADAGAVEQILWNLATNARDAMLHGGRLSFAVGDVELDDSYQAIQPWFRPGSYVRVTVTDTGVGMDAETVRRIYEPFFTTKPQGAGTGLGMAMVYGLVKQHGGFVNVYSEVGRGTTVTLYFPVAAGVHGSSRAATAPPGGALRGGTETILVVEDEEALRRLAARILRKFGYTVLAAGDGVEGLEIFRAHRAAIDLVITDLVMPRMGGRGLFDAIRAADPSARVIFSTGYGVRDLADLEGLGVDIVVLHKPWTLAELVQAVRRALDAGVPPAEPGRRAGEARVQ